MPNLENLKKQAKQILRWHHERHWPVAPQIRELLPAWRHLDDRQVFAREFKLAEAQEIVARRSGFDSWEALKRGLAEAPEPAAEAPVRGRVIQALPFVFVLDIAAACEFYSGKLGFAVTLAYGQPPWYAEVARDGVRLALRHVDEPVWNVARRTDEELLCALIQIDDAKAVFQEYQAAGVSFYQTLRTEPWGARGFIVQDPDGNLVGFGT